MPEVGGTSIQVSYVVSCGKAFCLSVCLSVLGRKQKKNHTGQAAASLNYLAIAYSPSWYRSSVLMRSSLSPCGTRRPAPTISRAFDNEH